MSQESGQDTVPFSQTDYCEVLEAWADQALRNSGALGKKLSYLRDKVIGGRVLKMTKDSHQKTARWHVEVVPSSP